MSALLSKLIKLTKQKEDYFTECLAECLRENQKFCESFLKIILEEKYPDYIEVVRSENITIKTQQTYINSRIDMLIEIGDFSLGVENKLWASEGENQLLKYLNLKELDGLVYITAGYERILPSDVLESPKHIKPENRFHFVWSDFYQAILLNRDHGNVYLTSNLEHLFRLFGFDPPHSEIGDLNDPNKEIAKRNKLNFKKLWKQTIEDLKHRGWKKFSPGSIAELYVENGKSELLKWLWFCPIYNRSLKVRLNFKNNIDVLAVYEFLEKNLSNIHPQSQIVLEKLKNRVNHSAKVIDIHISLKMLFGDADTSIDYMNQLSNYVSKIVELVDSVE